MGCGSRNKDVLVDLSRARSTVRIIFGSAKVKVSRSTVDRVFSQFCQISSTEGGSNAKLKLSVIGRVVRLRAKRVETIDRTNGKAAFAVAFFERGRQRRWGAVRRG